MKIDKPFLLTDTDFRPDNNTGCDEDATYNFSQSNIWSNSIAYQEPDSSLALLHSDLQEIKILVSEIKNLLKNYFSEE